jgi:hypothetical protein
MATDAGISICFIGAQLGDPCGASQWGCTNGLACVSGSCQLPSTGLQCPSTRDAGNCLAGDDCSAFAAFVYQCSASGNGPDCPDGDDCDPCQNWGLNCEQTAEVGSTCASLAKGFTCMPPAVYPPPEFPLAEEALSTYSDCTAGQSVCQPDPGDTAQPTCGSFFIEGENADGGLAPYPVPVCVEACTTGDDCGSLAWDCVGGECVPNYCYAQNDVEGDDISSVLTQGQPNAVTASVSVLFQPCANSGANTVCLPQNDNTWNTTTGICYRVGGPGSGGVGASCDPSGVRSDLGGLCQSGTLCFKGTCLPWCDTGNQTIAACAKNQQCVAVGGQLPSSTANANGTGVCTEDCDPYLPAAQNSCPQTSGQPPSYCKPSGTDSDQFPSPGACVGGSTAPVAIGATCNPYGWLDTCVSGAVCTQNKAQNGFACGQVCDPQPTPGVTEPTCASGTTCTPQGPPICEDDNNSVNPDAGFTGNYECYHIGVCL